jgi:hypothetical protein
MGGSSPLSERMELKKLKKEDWTDMYDGYVPGQVTYASPEISDLYKALL